jgi:hypothetical protein
MKTLIGGPRIRVEPWPQGIDRSFRRAAQFRHGLAPHQFVDALAIQDARALRDGTPKQVGIIPGSYGECFFANTADGTAVASTSSEASLLTGLNRQPTIPAGYLANQNAFGRAFRIVANGVFSNTGTPTLIFQARMSATLGAATLSGASIGVSAAIATGSGVTNKLWSLTLDLIATVPGIGTGNATLNSAGWVESFGGFASPFKYGLQITTPDTATWTQTFDASLAQYINLSVTWSANSASNTITLKQLYAMALN